MKTKKILASMGAAGVVIIAISVIIIELILAGNFINSLVFDHKVYFLNGIVFTVIFFIALTVIFYTCD